MLSRSANGSNESLASDGEGHGQSNLVDGANKKGAIKRRASRAGTRSVSTLSPAQLARKRANDREAQRNIRLRTKEHIERLEARIEELTKDNPADTEFDEVRRRNEELEAEVRKLSESLAHLGDDDNSANISLSTSQGSEQSIGSNYQNKSMFDSASSSLRGETSTPRFISLQGLGTSWSSYAPYSTTGIFRGNSGNNRHSFSAGLGSMEGIEQVLGPASTGALEDSSRFSYFDPITPMPFNDGKAWDHRSVSSGAQSSNLVSPSSGPSQSISGAPVIPNRPTVPIQMQSFDGVVPVSNASLLKPWDLPILNTSVPTCGVDNLLLAILRQQRELAQQGAPEEHTIGPVQPSMKALIYPEDRSQTHPISSMISNLLLNLAVRGLPERAGNLYLMYQLCQWQIAPSSSTYYHLTDWSSPRTSQLITPHPVWADSILWGKLKDKVIENQQLYANEEFQNAYILCLNANWPHDQLDAFRFEGNDVFITKEFETHIRTLSNWSLDEMFAVRYPELVGLVRITGT